MRKDDIMELGAYFKSIIDQDHAAVVICSLDHKIIYMNPAAAANYHKYGGAELLADHSRSPRSLYRASCRAGGRGCRSLWADGFADPGIKSKSKRI